MYESSSCSTIILHFILAVLIIVIPVSWNLTMVLICVFLQSSGVDHLFIYLTGHLYISFYEVSCKYFSHFYKLACLSYYWVRWVFFNKFWQKFFVRYIFCKYFLQVFGLPFYFLVVSFEKLKFLILMRSNISFFFFLFWLVILVTHLRNHCLSQNMSIKFGTFFYLIF